MERKQKVEDEIIRAAHEWDRAMVSNDPDEIGLYMANRGISGGCYGGEPFHLIERVSCVFVRQQQRWKCVLTHLSLMSGKDAGSTSGESAI